MAGAMRKMAVYLGLVEEDDHADDYDDYQDVRRDVRGRDRQGPGPERRHEERYEDRYDDRYGDREDDRYGRRNVRPLTDTRSVRTLRQETGAERRAPISVVPDRRPHAAHADLSRIETVHPRSYNDARRIGEDYREGVPVIMNLSELDDSDAKRIVDFAAGLVFGLQGSIERITTKVFLLSPANIDVGEAAREQVARDGFYNQS